MANRIPIVVDNNILRFEELQNGDNLFLANNSVSGVSTLTSDNVFAGIISSNTITANTFNTPSDIILKDEISPLVNALEVINSMRGVSWKWKHDQKASTGVLAQEVKKVIPEAVSEENGILTVNYLNIIGYLIEAIKELDAKKTNRRTRSTTHK